jgi:hypothetical protein
MSSVSAQGAARTLPPRPPADVAGLPRHAAIVIAFTLIAAAIRFSTLSLQSFWLDETVTVDLLDRSFGDMLAGVPDSESTPYLYYLLAWLWAQLLGLDETAIRSLSALFGTLTVPLAYLAGARLVSRRAGLVVAALAAVNPLLVWFSQEARAYALLVLLTTAALAVFARLLDRPTGRGLAGWGLLSALALATHYFAVFVVVPQAILLLRRSWRRGWRRGALAAVAGVAAAGAALIPLVVPQAQADRANFIEAVPLGERLLQVPKQYLVGFDAPLEAAATVIAVALALYGLWLLWRRADAAERRGAGRAAAVALPALGVPLVLALAGLDYFLTRNLIAAWVATTIVIAAGLGARAAGRAGIAAAAAMCALSLALVIAVSASPAHHRSDWRGAAEALGPIPQSARALVITPAPFGADALVTYSPDIVFLPPGPVGVGEIDVVAVANRRDGQSPRPPRPERLPPPPPGFGSPEVEEGDTYTLVRYRATDGVGPVTVPILVSLDIGDGEPDIAFQAPPGWQPPPLPPPG